MWQRKEIQEVLPRLGAVPMHAICGLEPIASTTHDGKSRAGGDQGPTFRIRARTGHLDSVLIRVQGLLVNPCDICECALPGGSRL